MLTASVRQALLVAAFAGEAVRIGCAKLERGYAARIVFLFKRASGGASELAP